MADRKPIEPLAIFDSIVVIDATPLLGEPQTTAAGALAALSRAGGLAREPDLPLPRAAPPERLSHAHLLDILRRVDGVDIKRLDRGDALRASDLRLSPRRPYIDGRGHLDFYGARVLGGDSDLAHFTDDDPELARVEIWLKGLVPGGSYLAQLRLSGPSSGRFRVRGSDTGGEIEFAAGPGLTVLAVVQDVQHELSLLAVEALECASWTFYDISFTPL
ncbi:hypothetical protein SAMN02745121_04495 [Nannocystis exedens]|uniref:Uncharacterized protein n=1 Tax=Nannocystis exedens TaxID=54 RepID=A0A1I2B384_9BACT|nr:hypothetical protein [Nannocystis exedens]PCC74396.1 hypothetical protein NAEX_07487 [Nannocystis exedens]SFE49630.1 hypothetical protein SAMN02745121_04495 [Nannocystis exedens]